MRLEIHWFEPSTVNSDGSQTLEPSNRLNRIEKTVQQTVPGSLAKTTDTTPAPHSARRRGVKRLTASPRCGRKHPLHPPTFPAGVGNRRELAPR